MLELDHYVFISNMSMYYQNLGPIFVAVKGVKIKLFKSPVTSGIDLSISPNKGGQFGSQILIRACNKSIDM